MFTYKFIRSEYGFFVMFLLALAITSAQPKGYLYDEQKVRSYTLPNPLVCIDGSAVKDTKVWNHNRRSEILRLFENEVYGRAPGKPKHMEFMEIEKDTIALKGMAKRKQIAIKLGKGDKELVINLLIYSPTKTTAPVPGYRKFSW